MVRYIFAVGPVAPQQRGAFDASLPILVEEAPMLWLGNSVVIIRCGDGDAHSLRWALRRTNWPFLLSSSPRSSVGHLTAVLSTALSEQWAREEGAA